MAEKPTASVLLGLIKRPFTSGGTKLYAQLPEHEQQAKKSVVFERKIL